MVAVPVDRVALCGAGVRFLRVGIAVCLLLVHGRECTLIAAHRVRFPLFHRGGQGAARPSPARGAVRRGAASEMFDYAASTPTWRASGE